MPIYEYQCDACGKRSELLQKISDPPANECPACGQAGLRRLVSAAAFHLKGGGWYATDFKDSGRSSGASRGEHSAASDKPGKEKVDKRPAAGKDVTQS